MNIKIRLFKGYLWSITPHEYESLITRENKRKIIETFEMRY